MLASDRRRQIERAVVLRGIHGKWILIHGVPRDSHPPGSSLKLFIVQIQSAGQEYHKGDEGHLERNQSKRPGDNSVVTGKSEQWIRLQDNSDEFLSYPPEGAPVSVAVCWARVVKTPF